MTYEIIFKKSALKDLMSLPAPDVNSIVQKIDDLALNPRLRGCKKLRGGNHSFWRIRSGNFRIIYSIDDAIRIIEINVIGHRKEIY